MNKFRTYTTHSENGKVSRSLLTWTQLRCIICGRFLGLNRKKYCSKCANDRIGEKHTTYMRQWRKVSGKSTAFYNNTNPILREEQRLRKFIYSHAPEINIGDQF